MYAGIGFNVSIKIKEYKWYWLKLFQNMVNMYMKYNFFPLTHLFCEYDDIKTTMYLKNSRF